MYGNVTHSNRLISVYDLYKDMTTKYKCPDCGYTWDRFKLEVK